MPEKTPSHEFNEEPTESEEDEVDYLLKEYGAESPEAKQALIDWTIRQETLVDQSSSVEARIQFELLRARLYLKAGYKEEALQAFKDAYLLAWNGRKDELAKQIMQEADNLKQGRNLNEE